MKRIVSEVENETKYMRRKSNKIKAVYRNFTYCGTSTGWFIDWCCMRRDSEIESNLGMGIAIYFKQLKSLICMLFICTLLSLPSYFLFWGARSHMSMENNFDEVMLALSLGSLGEQFSYVNQLELRLY